MSHHQRIALGECARAEKRTPPFPPSERLKLCAKKPRCAESNHHDKLRAHRAG
jgi:hypothetical protein